jgi:hypothetical protein
MPDDFWKLTMADFIRLNEAFFYADNTAWDRIRYLAAMIINSNPWKKRTIRPKDLFTLPIDNARATKVELPTEEDFQALRKLRKKL